MDWVSVFLSVVLPPSTSESSEMFDKNAGSWSPTTTTSQTPSEPLDTMRQNSKKLGKFLGKWNRETETDG